MGYFVYFDYLKNGVTRVRKALASTKMRDYAALLLAYKQGGGLTRFRQTSHIYLQTAKAIFRVNSHIITIRGNHLGFTPRHFYGALLTKRLITLMWSCSLGNGFPSFIDCKQGNRCTEMAIAYSNGYIIKVSFRIKNGKAHFAFFQSQKYCRAYGIIFKNLSIGSQVIFDVFDPECDGCETDPWHNWEGFLCLIHQLVDSDPDSVTRDYVSNGIKTTIRATNIEGTVFGYCADKNIVEEKDEYSLFNGFYIEECSGEEENEKE